MAEESQPTSTTSTPKDDRGAYYNDLVGPHVFDEPSMFVAGNGPVNPNLAADATDSETGGDGGDKGGDKGAGDKGGDGKAAAADKGKPEDKSTPSPSDESFRKMFPDAEHSGYDGDRRVDQGQRQEERDASEHVSEESSTSKGGRKASKQSRYDAAIAGVSEAREETASERRRRLTVEAENEQLRRELADAKAGKTAAPTGDATGDRTTGQGQETDPNAGFTLKKPVADDFDTHDEWETALEGYYEKLHAHRASTKAAADARAAEQDRETDAIRQRRAADEAQWNENRRVITEADDFKKVAEALAPIRSPWHDEKEFGQILAPALDHFLRVSPKGGEVGLFLGRNPEVAKALAQLPGHPNQHPLNMQAWDRMARGLKDPVSMLQFMASEPGQKWFTDLGTAQGGIEEVIDSIAEVRGRLAAVTALREQDAEGGGGTAPSVRVSQAPDPSTPPQGTSTGELTSVEENFNSAETDANYDRIFDSRFKRRYADAQRVSPVAAAVVPGRAQLGM